jgi:NTP pyrophosphatase (non-canonical NTP hydrolase)
MLSDLQAELHGNAVRAGWWTDLETGEPVKRCPDHFLAKLCLVHSEVSEACEGYRKGLMDDHLPHRKMAEVELADAVIRILDLAGGYGFDLEGAIREKMEYNKNREDHKIENRMKAGGKKA